MELASWNAHTMTAVQSCWIDSNKIVFNNTNLSKYFSARLENTDYKFYNSALFILGTGINFFIICEEQTTQTFYHNGTPSGTREMNVENNNLWSNPMCSSSPMYIYCATWNNCGSLISSNIPTFYDYQEYLNYITNPFVPQSGGAGSGYIGNSSLVSYTAQKKMVGYNVPTSSAGSTKTESVNTNDVNPEPNTPKINNGHIRIKYIREEVIPSYLSEVGTYLIGRPDNKQHLKTVPKWGNGNYDGSAETQWTWPMSLYHPNTNINSDHIDLASFTDGATVNIDTTNGINVTYTGFTASRLFYRYGYPRARIGLSWEDPLASTPKGAYWCGYQSGNDSDYAPTKNDFTSLDQLFEYIYNHFRHCNVVLNGTTIVTETSE